ncbi:nitroreductase family protein [Pyrodictium delaneyi]|uniref:Nitroreductase domain-containing protein n=1 Tax=Pyrodictium delaneyi TaxID=1273541 RepID=A0A211YPQ1_9CREN|nr:nitroreductase family protein [Pyrodictium delaneyi]OWJ54896.1 hypothetical protein Pdsh_04100 [Pyrodictium delaneyi]
MTCKSCLDIVERHASVRSFRPDPVDPKDLEKILEAARRAPTSWNLQPLTVTVVTDPMLRERLAEAVGGQKHVAEAPVFLVFSIDYHKVLEAARAAGVEPAEPGLGHLVIGALDAGIASGWAALAAEELGYGIVFIALYSNPCRIADILGLPRHVLPIVGLCVGKPAETPEPRPRHPMEVFAAENRYPSSEGLTGKVASVYGQKAGKLYSYVLARGGYYERVGEALLQCMKERGYKPPVK